MQLLNKAGAQVLMFSLHERMLAPVQGPLHRELVKLCYLPQVG